MTWNENIIKLRRSFQDDQSFQTTTGANILKLLKHDIAKVLLAVILLGKVSMTILLAGTLKIIFLSSNEQCVSQPWQLMRKCYS